MKTIIIENELKAQRLLTKIINEYCTELDILGVAKSISAGRQLILEKEPELIFLDIQLDDGDGFDLLDVLKTQNLKIIFTTAFNDYAIKAFKYEAIDYLLKPISPKDVMKAVEKATKISESQLSYTKLKALLDRVQDDRLSIKTNEGISMIPKSEIVRIEGDGAYATIYLMNGQKEMVSRSIGNLEKEISSDNFLRVHTSHLINKNHLRKYIREDGGYALMSNGAQVPVSRRKKDVLF